MQRILSSFLLIVLWVQASSAMEDPTEKNFGLNRRTLNILREEDLGESKRDSIDSSQAITEDASLNIEGEMYYNMALRNMLMENIFYMPMEDILPKKKKSSKHASRKMKSVSIHPERIEETISYLNRAALRGHEEAKRWLIHFMRQGTDDVKSEIYYTKALSNMPIEDIFDEAMEDILSTKKKKKKSSKPVNRKMETVFINPERIEETIDDLNRAALLGHKGAKRWLIRFILQGAIPKEIPIITLDPSIRIIQSEQNVDEISNPLDLISSAEGQCRLYDLIIDALDAQTTGENIRNSQLAIFFRKLQGIVMQDSLKVYTRSYENYSLEEYSSELICFSRYIKPILKKGPVLKKKRTLRLRQKSMPALKNLKKNSNQEKE